MSVIYARPAKDWPVLGLRGQHIGSIEHCAIDTMTGEIRHLVLRTAWQKIEVEWPAFEFDDSSQSFKLVKPP